MTISFNSIPNDLLTPFQAIEFDSTRAQTGPSIQEYKVLLLGLMTSAGTATAEKLVQIFSAEEAETKFGKGSPLHAMCKKFLENNLQNKLFAIPQAEEGGASSSAGTLTFTGTATAAGTIYLYLAGRKVTVSVAVGDTDIVIVAALQAAIVAMTEEIPFTSAINGGDPTILDLTSIVGGEAMTDLDVRVNYLQGEELPAGVALVIVPMAAGAVNPTIAAAIVEMGDEQYNLIGMQYSDAANLTLAEAEGLVRWGPLVQKEGQFIVGKDDTQGNLSTLGDSRNSQFMTIMGTTKILQPSWECISAVVGQVAIAGQIDPARPFQTLPLLGLSSPSSTERFTLTQRNNLLKDSISSFVVDSGGVVRIERLITTRDLNDVGAPDLSFLDLNTMLTLSYLRFDLRAQLSSRFPRFKIADDGTRIAPGQAVTTPEKIGAELIAIFRAWEKLGLVENGDQFKSDLIVERNLLDPNRVDIRMGPDLINQLRVEAVQIQFLR